MRCYRIYDKYGHLDTSSQTFDTRTEMVTYIKKEELRWCENKDVAGWPYTIITFKVPETVKIKGKVFRVSKKGG
jgi:hypothetical protein